MELLRLDEGVEEAQAALEVACCDRAVGQDEVDRARAALSECRLEMAAARLGALDWT